MRVIADSVGAYLLSDMAHTSGWVAAGVIPSPFVHSDIVTTTTHKALRGPRGAMIFFREGVRRVDKKGNKELNDLESRINSSVFPGYQGGPHNHTISALAVALHQTKTPEFKAYAEAVLAHARLLVEYLGKPREEGGYGYQVVSGGTDNQIVLLDLRDHGVDGARVQRVFELVNIAANKNTVPGDSSGMTPSGLRLGSVAMTTRGFGAEDFKRVAAIIDRVISLTLSLVPVMRKKAEDSGLKNPGSVKAFLEVLGKGDDVHEILELQKEVEEWAGAFKVPWEK